MEALRGREVEWDHEEIKRMRNTEMELKEFPTAWKEGLVHI